VIEFKDDGINPPTIISDCIIDPQSEIMVKFRYASMIWHTKNKIIELENKVDELTKLVKELKP
jgi:hypothetical protein